MATLILVRGLPGSGKSTVGHLISDAIRCEADHFFVRHGNGVYKFDPSLLPQAHAECQKEAREALEMVSSGRGSYPIVVSNTFSCRWEMEPYLQMAREYKAWVHVVDVYDGGLTNEELAVRNKHGVPVEGIAAMRSRWEHDWKAGNPLPPWERG